VFSILGFFNFFVCVVRDSTHGNCTFIFDINFLTCGIRLDSIIFTQKYFASVGQLTNVIFASKHFFRPTVRGLANVIFPSIFSTTEKKKKIFSEKIKSRNPFLFSRKEVKNISDCEGIEQKKKNMCLAKLEKKLSVPGNSCLVWALLPSTLKYKL